MLKKNKPYLILLTILFTKAGSLFLGLLFSMIVANNLGPKEYGNYSVFVSSATAIASFLIFGLDVSINKDIAKFSYLNKNLKDSIISLLIFLLMFSCGSLIGIFLVYPNYFIESSILLLLIFLLWFNNLQIAFLNALKFVVFSQFSIFFVKNFLLLSLSFGFIYIFSHYSFSYLNFIILYIAVTFITIILNYLFIKFKTNQTLFFNAKINIKSLIDLIKKNYLLCVIYTYIFIESLLPLFVLKSFNLNFEAGIYAFALLFFFIFSMPLTTINSYMMPRISKFIIKKKYGDLQHLISRSTKFSFSFILIGFILLLLFLKPFLLKVFPEYNLAYTPIILVCLTQVINTYFGPTALLTILLNKLKFLGKVFFMSSLIFFLSSIILKNMGIDITIALSISLLFAVLGWNLVTFIYLKFYFKVSTRFCLN